jgi:hypothetical protein
MGGTVANTCQWPATVLMQGCSGTLVHPEIVIYAAHCPSTSSVRFGVYGNDRSVGTEYCRAAPEYPSTGYDYRFCKLSQPVNDVPIAPVIMGCEIDQIAVGTTVYMVGFGNTNNQGGGFGTKRWVEAEIAGFPSYGRLIGVWYADDDTGICSGDSGGSMYVELEDGSWRSVGINVTVAPPCGGSSQSVPMWAKVAWVEETSGVDITPCHDADGSWNPSADCTGFAMAPNDGSGLSWNTGCGPGPESGASSVCGPPYGDPQDTTAPTIEIVTPSSGAVPGPEFSTPIEISADDDWGILDVGVAIDGEQQAVLTAPPYELENVLFREGTWEIDATARDWSGNVTDAATVVLVVGEGDGDDGGSTDDTGATDEPDGTGPSTDDDGGDTESGEPPGGSDGGDESDDGCGCRSTHGSPVAFAAFVLLALACRRRW